MKVVSSKVLAGCLALAAFAVAILAGLASGNPAAQILLRAVVAMIACYPVGFIVGLLCERAIADHVNEAAKAMSQPEAQPSAPPTQSSGDEEPIVV